MKLTLAARTTTDNETRQRMATEQRKLRAEIGPVAKGGECR